MSNEAFDSIIINLVENIRSEMLNLTRDLHTLELNISTINRLEEKTDNIKQRCTEIHSKFDHLDNLVDELQEKISDVKLIETMQTNMSKVNDRLNAIEQDMIVIKQREMDRVDASKEHQQIKNGIVIVIVTAVINFFIWLLTGSKA